ncbi:MAG: hypothetical protein PHX02_07315 [Oscillospiraceae bacterium]|nr:hypothetical protein [Oscillospiraceae bacterium]
MKNILVLMLTVVIMMAAFCGCQKSPTASGTENVTSSFSDNELVSMVESMTQQTKEKPDLMLSSNAHDYINAHKKTFDLLVSSKQCAVDCFTKILRNSKTFGLDKYIMAAVCCEITGVGKDGGWSSADEWIRLYGDA